MTIPGPRPSGGGGSREDRAHPRALGQQASERQTVCGSRRRGLGPPYSGILSANLGPAPRLPGRPHAPAPLASRDRRHAHRLGLRGVRAPLVPLPLPELPPGDAALPGRRHRVPLHPGAARLDAARRSHAAAQPRDHADQAQHDHRRVLQRVRHRRAGAHREARHRSGRDSRRSARADGMEARGLRAGQAGVPASTSRSSS